MALAAVSLPVGASLASPSAAMVRAMASVRGPCVCASGTDMAVTEALEAGAACKYASRDDARMGKSEGAMLPSGHVWSLLVARALASSLIAIAGRLRRDGGVMGGLHGACAMQVIGGDCGMLTATAWLFTLASACGVGGALSMVERRGDDVHASQSHVHGGPHGSQKRCGSKSG